MFRSGAKNQLEHGDGGDDHQKTEDERSSPFYLSKNNYRTRDSLFPKPRAKIFIQAYGGEGEYLRYAWVNDIV